MSDKVALGTSVSLPEQLADFPRERYDIELPVEHSTGLERVLGLQLEQPTVEGELIHVDDVNRRLAAVARTVRRRVAPIRQRCTVAQLSQWAGNRTTDPVPELMALAGVWEGLAITYSRGLWDDCGLLTFERRWATMPVLVWSKTDLAATCAVLDLDPVEGSASAALVRHRAQEWLRGADTRGLDPIPMVSLYTPKRDVKALMDATADRLPGSQQPDPLRRRVEWLRILANWALDHAFGGPDASITWG